VASRPTGHLLGYLSAALKTERRTGQKKVRLSIPYFGVYHFFAFLPDRLPPATGRGVVGRYSLPFGRDSRIPLPSVARQRMRRQKHLTKKHRKIFNFARNFLEFF